MANINQGRAAAFNVRASAFSASPATLNLSPDVLKAILNLSGGGGGGQNPGTTGTPNLPSSMPADLQALLAAIPVAQDGHVITSEYHNSLRAALLLLASQLGVDLNITHTATFTPNFVAVGTNPTWSFINGIASTGTDATGLLPIQLPDGVLMQSMTVIGSRDGGKVASFRVQLRRQAADNLSLDDTSMAVLAEVPLENILGQFQKTAPVQASGSNLGPSATQALTLDYQTVDNSRYKYFIFATVTGSDSPAGGLISAIQITYQG